MKRKKWLLVSILCATTIIVILLASYSFKTEILFTSPLFPDKTAALIRKDTSLNIRELNPYSYLLKAKEKNGREKLVRLLIEPNPTNNTGSLLRFQYLKKGILFVVPSEEDNIALLAKRIDNDLNNTVSLYGFAIERTTVKDTTFLFKSLLVQKDSLFPKITLAYDTLIRYARKKNIDYRGVRILNIYRIDSNRSQLNVSISIHSPLKEALTEGIAFKQMPYKKNLLEADYKGPFNQLHQVFEAMEQYKTDYNLVNMAIPYVALPEHLQITSDSQLIEVKAYYPYF